MARGRGPAVGRGRTGGWAGDGPAVGRGRTGGWAGDGPAVGRGRTVAHLPASLLAMSPRACGLAIGAGLSAIALAACGGSSGNGVAAKSPEQIVRAASSAITHAKSVHVSGSITIGGVPLRLDLTLVSGKGGRGQMSEGGLSFQIIDIDNTVYIEGSPAFWSHFGGSTAAKLLQGRWLKAPATGQFASIAELTNMQQLLGNLLLKHGSLSKGPTTTVRGQRVVPVTGTAAGGVLYVATTGKPYPVEVKKQGSSGGEITFDRYDQPVSLTPPANAVDISRFG